MSMSCSYCLGGLRLTFISLTDEIGVVDTVCPFHRKSLCNAESDSGVYDMVYFSMVRAFICEWLLD